MRKVIEKKFVFNRKYQNDEIGVDLYSIGKRYKKNTVFIVPNMPEFIRDVTEYGSTGAVLKRILQLNFKQIITLIWWNKFKIFPLLKKHFSTGIILLIQIDLLKIKEKNDSSLILLSDQITDLAVALNNLEILISFKNLIVEKLNMDFAYMTNNFPLTITKLSNWGIKHFKYIFTPFNSYGYEMNPSKKEVEMYIDSIYIKKIVAIIAHESKSEYDYLNKHKIRQVLVGWF